MTESHEHARTQSNLMEVANQQAPAHSFLEVLHEAPRLLDLLPPASRKSLSATCRSLRISFCTRVSVITLSEPADTSKLCCTTWPQLTMVMCTHGSNLRYLKLRDRLSAGWECMVEMELGVWPFGGQSPSKTTHRSAVLVRARQQFHTPLNHISHRHHAALSAFADMNRHSGSLTLQGPFVGCSVVQCLTHDCWPLLRHLTLANSPNVGLGSMPHLSKLLSSLTIIGILDCGLDASDALQLGTGSPQILELNLYNNQLDASSISSMAHAKWPSLCRLSMCSNTLGCADMQHLVSCSWPSLRSLNLTHACLDASSLQCLAQGQWPALQHLNLSGNSIDAKGISVLVQGGWPLLVILSLSDQGLDEEACSLLGMTKVDISRARIIVAQRLCLRCPRVFCCDSYLPHFPQLTLRIC